eukprot:CAMPEP_0177406766 /NCGR_PEP_ID=MMETSP0368-20130122/62739_1 /TAXON_ID=447022 ORGANISM="Scrippsiella hangoei-like, Strain SHHI-4" /NCGR_SAMPLE_ID=MMETSP0368 /ASSEMBLY_ACC=CAM_ASM_000363 /LENGTH=177 /DNA_ID=CAMNT_0018875197 /DNA_START=146 /DNA_END=674 /DNA_ORIENTATION=+
MQHISVSVISKCHHRTSAKWFKARTRRKPSGVGPMDAEGASCRHRANQADEPGASKQGRDEQVPSEARTAISLEPPGGGGPPAAHGQARGDAEHGQQDAKGLRPSDKRRQRCRIEPECRPRCAEVEYDQLRGHNAQQVCQAHRRQASHRIAALMALHGPSACPRQLRPAPRPSGRGS